MTAQPHSIPVVDVDNAFPAMTGAPASRRDAAAGGDVSTQVSTALRDILGWRPRAADPAGFSSALEAAFRLRLVEGHVEADYVPRGYAVQADLGAVTGGQASLYRRATLARSEALRILDGLTALRPDADAQDMDSYRGLVRNAVERLVDEIGAAGGPRVQMVNMYFAGLTGSAAPVDGTTADNVAGQLGALRDRFGLVDGNVNTVEEEGVRTAFWTLVDLVSDLHGSWYRQVSRFSGGQGFLGTDLILLSRLMEAAADQVDELEEVLDSVLIAESERRTLLLGDDGLTLDGLLTWLRDFLGQEGRRIAQDAGRDGIVSGLAPMAVELVKTFKQHLADRLNPADVTASVELPIVYLPASCCSELPAGMYAARTRIAVAALCRLLMDLARTAQRIGRWAEPVIINVTFRPVQAQAGVHEVEFRGLNLQPTSIPAFVLDDTLRGDGTCTVDDFGTDGLLLAKRGSSTADSESISALFDSEAIGAMLDAVGQVPAFQDEVAGGFSLPAEVLPLAVIDGETGRIVHAPEPVSWPTLREARIPAPPTKLRRDRWTDVPDDEAFRRLPDPVEPGEGDAEDDDDAALLGVAPDVWKAILTHPVKGDRLRDALKRAGYRVQHAPQTNKPTSDS